MILKPPSKGLSRSVNKHNSDVGIICDWVEASALFSEDGFSGSDFVDVLIEQNVYRDQEFAWEFFDIVLANIRGKAKVMGHGYPLVASGGKNVTRKSDWRDFAAYSFCLALSLPQGFPEWASAFGSDFTEQGELFETLTSESVKATFTGWEVRKTGWARNNTKRLNAVVQDVADALGEALGSIERWTKSSAKEAGLDVLLFRPFPDSRVGIPVYMVQCASGGDWESKLKTPDLQVWRKIVDFAATPQKAFSMPFALDTDEFRRSTLRVDGLFLDRYRLLAPGQQNGSWLTEGLKQSLTEWLTPRVQALPFLSATA